MSVYAITGNLASGKSTVLHFFKKKSVEIFDADQRVHHYYNDRKSLIYKKVAAQFSAAVRGQLIDRRQLAKITFGDKKKLQILERIVHPVIIYDLKRWINQINKSKKFGFAEVPLLFEKKLETLFDASILVYVKREILLPRIQKTWHISQHAARARLSLYMPIYKKRHKADYIINNNATIAQLHKEIESVWKQIKQI